MFKLQELIAKFPVIRFSGKAESEITGVVEITALNDNPFSIAWCSPKNINQLDNISAGTIICPLMPENFFRNPSVNYLEVANPRQYFAQMLQWLTAMEESASGIASTAMISQNVQLGKNISIGQHVVIEEGCVIGDHVKIGHNTVLHKKTNVGNHVIIGCNCTIGGIGFGYEKNEDGQYEMLPHIGNVVIEDNVEIAHNVCIDRAVLTSTIIRKHVKIDNLVHIAHNVVIGENSLIIANSMIGGSTVIGKNVWVAPSASVMNKLKIGDDSIIGLAAVVVKNVEEKTTVVGNPAKPLPPKNQ